MTWEWKHGGNLGQQTSLLDICVLNSHLSNSYPMDCSSIASSEPHSDAPGSGDHIPNLREDEVKILQNNPKEWVAANKAKKQTIVQNIADNIKKLPPNRRLKSREWVIKKKVSSMHILLSRPVLPDWELTKGGSAIMSGCQQCARAMKL